ncbi:hypothetical protein JXJ21_14735 [candidate division KSB1 bacterium]|nr:hypothetical protein [candidate division KSB1 bacterium]
MKIYNIFCIILIVCFAAYAFAGETTRPAYLPDLRNQAMGGLSVVNAQGSFAYTYNPALLASGESSMTLGALQVAFSDNFFDIFEYIADNSDNFKKLNSSYTPKLTAQQSDSLIDYLRREAVAVDNIWYNGNIIPFAGIALNNFGFGVYSVANASIRSDVGILIPKFWLKVYDDLVFAAGYGKYYKKNLALGVNVKLIRRFEAPLVKIQVEEADNFEKALDDGLDELQEGKWGYGLDIGALYHLSPRTQVGLMLQDFLGQIDQVNTPMNLKIGVQHQVMPRLAVGGEFKDFFNRNGDHLFNKFHFGAEYRLPVLRFRLGFNQGYPTAGVGLDLWILQLNYTYFEYELTPAPGQRGEAMHKLGLRITPF